MRDVPHEGNQAAEGGTGEGEPLNGKEHNKGGDKRSGNGMLPEIGLGSGPTVIDNVHEPHGRCDR